MMADANDNQTQFNEVLSRLDALMKRNQSSATPPPLPAEPFHLKLPSEEESSLAASDPFVVLEEPADIPVLTDIYDGTAQATEDDSELALAVVDALLPMLLENLDIIVAEEAARMQQNVADRLRHEIATTLRERLGPKL